MSRVEEPHVGELGQEKTKPFQLQFSLGLPLKSRPHYNSKASYMTALWNQRAPDSYKDQNFDQDDQKLSRKTFST